jgi:streptogramin lyase
VVLQFSGDGRHTGTFASIDAERLAANALDQVALLDKQSNAVQVVDRDGRPLLKVGPRGTGFELRDPVDVAFDAFGHLYVLDRDAAAVHAFAPDGKWLTSFTVPDKSPAAFRKARSLAVDNAGRLLIFDERAEKVLIFQ